MLRIIQEKCSWERPESRSLNLKVKVKDNCRPVTLVAPLGKGAEGAGCTLPFLAPAGPPNTLAPSYLDSCFCSWKRSSSSWTRCTKSFSVGERKTPSKQRRARVIGGRACGADGQGRGQSRPRATPTPQCRCCKGLRGIVVRVSPAREKQASRWGRDVPRSPGTTAAGHGRGSWPPHAGPMLRGLCARAARAPPGLTGSRARAESRRGRGRLGPGRPTQSALPSPGARGPEGAVRSQGSDQPQTTSCTHRSRPARHRRPEDPQKPARPCAPDNSPGFGVGAAPPCVPGEALQKWQRA